MPDMAQYAKDARNRGLELAHYCNERGWLSTPLEVAVTGAAVEGLENALKALALAILDGTFDPEPATPAQRAHLN